MSKLLRLPNATPDGALYGHIGKYAGTIVMTVFEEMGGVARMTAWAEKNPDDFYTKVFTKVVAKPVEHTVAEGVESLLERLDAADRRVVTDTSNATDAEFEEA
jgi:hypothetical protein